jgi:hypothetical protein
MCGEEKRLGVAEICFWKVLKLDVDDAGSVAVTSDVPNREIGLLRELLAKVEENLIRETRTDPATIGNVIGSVLSEY